MYFEESTLKIRAYVKNFKIRQILCLLNFDVGIKNVLISFELLLSIIYLKFLFWNLAPEFWNFFKIIWNFFQEFWNLLANSGIFQKFQNSGIFDNLGSKVTMQSAEMSIFIHKRDLYTVYTSC